VDVAFWESFGKGWYGDAKKELKLPTVNAFKADYGWLLLLNAQSVQGHTNVPRCCAGLLPQLPTDPENDVLFTWNGTTSGVKARACCVALAVHGFDVTLAVLGYCAHPQVPNADWIAKDRAGLMFCDATSAVFAQDVTINKLDVITYSWQKVCTCLCLL
jgi:phosphoserine aminotransferase